MRQLANVGWLRLSMRDPLGSGFQIAIRNPLPPRPVLPCANRQVTVNHVRARRFPQRVSLVQIRQRVDQRVVRPISPNRDHPRHPHRLRFVEVLRHVIWAVRHGNHQFAKLFPQHRLDFAPEPARTPTACMRVQNNQRLRHIFSPSKKLKAELVFCQYSKEFVKIKWLDQIIIRSGFKSSIF